LKASNSQSIMHRTLKMRALVGRSERNFTSRGIIFPPGARAQVGDTATIAPLAAARSLALETIVLITTKSCSEAERPFHRELYNRELHTSHLSMLNLAEYWPHYNYGGSLLLHFEAL
jgi:hypothetical protein